MKKQIFSLGLMLAAAFTLTNCAKEIENPAQEPETAGYPFEIVASTVDTKTVNDGMSTKWAEGDQINLFHAVTDATTYTNDNAFTVSDVEAGKFTGNLAGELDPQEEYDWYALYPYNEKITTPGSQTAGYTYIGYSKGLNQTGYNSMASLKETVCPLYGVLKACPAGTTPSIQMQHLSSVVAINVTNANEEPLTVTTASFTAEEDIVGSYYFDLTTSPVTYTASGTNYVYKTATVNVTSGATALAKGESAVLYLAIKPFTAKAGSKLVLSVQGYEKELELQKDVTFSAGKIKTLNFSYDKEDEPEEEGSETWTWDLTKSSYGSASASEVKWTSDYVNMVLAQGKSSTAANNYLGGTNAHTRVYKDQILTFITGDAVQIEKIEFSVVSGYMDEFRGATWSNATTVDNNIIMTVTPVDEHQPVSATIGSATRFTSVKVYYTIDADYVPPTLVSIKVANPKTEYFVGDEFEAPKVIAVYDNGNEVDVNEGVSFVGFDSSAVNDEQEITVKYNDKSTTYIVSIAEIPVIGDGPVPSGTVLWEETWADAGANSTTFANNSAISTYDYAGRSGYGDNATSVTYTADASNNVRITKSSGANCASGHLWFNKSVAGELKTSSIKLYGATSLIFSHSQGTSGSSCQALYSLDGGSTWKSLGIQSGAIVEKKYTFTVPEGTESIMIKLSHASTNAKNTRVDNLVLKAN